MAAGYDYAVMWVNYTAMPANIIRVSIIHHHTFPVSIRPQSGRESVERFKLYQCDSGNRGEIPAEKYIFVYILSERNESGGTGNVSGSFLSKATFGYTALPLHTHIFSSYLAVADSNDPDG